MFIPNSLNIIITPKAQSHFETLLEQEATEGMAIRISVDLPGSPIAQVDISFCPLGENKLTDILIPLARFSLYVDKTSASYLEGATLDYKMDDIEGQLAITAPNLRGQKPKEDASLLEKVTYCINSEVNPNLASHGGRVSVVEVNEKNEVFLRFGGGCQGCGMVNVTLKDGIEITLMEKLPEITAVIDVTHHDVGENPYY
ncbi:MAG TPA: NifU family protein [Gammaproteobacteria bacterium]|nr:NifU family protein [Gammaproteobacteria bacterium]